MDTSKITTSLLKSVLKLAEKRDALLSKLAEVELAIKKASAAPAPAKSTAPAKPAARRGRPAKVVAAAPAPKAVKVAKAPAVKKSAPVVKAVAPISTGRRGALKDSIIAELQAAGANGISVKELSDKLGVKNQNVHVWFSTTGRKLGNIQKVGSGKYGWKA